MDLILLTRWLSFIFMFLAFITSLYSSVIGKGVDRKYSILWLLWALNYTIRYIVMVITGQMAPPDPAWVTVWAAMITIQGALTLIYIGAEKVLTRVKQANGGYIYGNRLP